MIIEFDTKPKPHVLLAEQHARWSVPGAISELVDNSFGEKRGNAKNVQVVYHKHVRVIDVLDDGAGFTDLSRLLQLGNTIGKSPTDIGIYGAGGTKALLWLGREVTIWSMHGGKISKVMVNWEKLTKAKEFEKIEGSCETATPANTPKALFDVGHGTLIRIFLLDQRKVYETAVMSELSKTYAPAIREGRILRWHTRSKPGNYAITEGTALSDPITSKFKKSVKIDITVEVTHPDGKKVSLPVTGEVGIVPDHPASDSKVSFGFGPRIVFSTKDCYGNDDVAYSGRDIVGWATLGAGWPIYMTTTKDGIDSRPVYDALMEELFKQIEPLLKETEDNHSNIVLEGLGVSLTVMMQRAVLSEESKVDPDTDDGTNAEKVYPDGPRNKRKTGEKADKRPGGEKDVPKHPQKDNGSDDFQPMQCEIEVHYRTDKGMKETLCMVDPPKDGNGKIMVFVNKDHWYMQECMKGGPASRAMLIHAVTREMANMLEGEPALRLKAFGRKATAKFEAMDEVSRERYLHRRLLDSWPRPGVTA